MDFSNVDGRFQEDVCQAGWVLSLTVIHSSSLPVRDAIPGLVAT